MCLANIVRECVFEKMVTARLGTIPVTSQTFKELRTIDAIRLSIANSNLNSF